MLMVDVASGVDASRSLLADSVLVVAGVGVSLTIIAAVVSDSVDGRGRWRGRESGRAFSVLVVAGAAV
ncbi:hypothetical protein JR316_0006652 [Psilocybe cubensis]|uniref:Uncharacterized protein n=1 Tax=Psilocybe cubensis TaxID=181762 RepID=A0ACB8GWD4_PSICU|nr:hypothetical protein JR316_0006652 [Psilocybe cubensis]KAH9480055.1 hypothetical protein JR316_0006652 [Psilocybe cubensis]